MSAKKITKWAADAASYRRLQWALWGALLLVAATPVRRGSFLARKPQPLATRSPAHKTSTKP
jgi:hypothetical protein